MKEKNDIFTDERKTGDLQNISGVLLPLAKKLVGKKAFAEADVICNWENRIRSINKRMSEMECFVFIFIIN